MFVIKNLPPMPKSLLVHKVKYKPQNEESTGWGRGLGNEVEVRNVLVVSTVTYQPNETGVKVPVSKTTLYYDYKHSLPKSINFQNDDIITWNGLEYKVVSVQDDPFSNHHKELGLEVS